MTDLTIETCVPAPVSVMIEEPVVTEACSPDEVELVGELVAVNGVAITPREITSDLKLPIGSHEVQWRAFDGVGNSTTVAQSVSVILIENASCCEAGQTVVEGTEGVDAFQPGTEPLCVFGYDGGDSFSSAYGGNSLFSGGGGDHFTVSGDDDLLVSSEGDDSVQYTGYGEVSFYGGPGDDNLSAPYGMGSVAYGGPGNDYLVGGSGSDFLVPGPGTDFAFGGAGDDTIAVIHPCELEPGEFLDGGPGMDSLITPVPIADFGLVGVSVQGFENVVLSDSGYLSECFFTAAP